MLNMARLRVNWKQRVLCTLLAVCLFLVYLVIPKRNDDHKEYHSNNFKADNIIRDTSSGGMEPSGDVEPSGSMASLGGVASLGDAASIGGVASLGDAASIGGVAQAALKGGLNGIVRGNKNSTTKPHIVFILADDMGWNDVGYHGSEIKTPVIDRLAEAGVKLDNYYVQHVCSPSRASLMSGLYQSHTSINRIIQPSEIGCLPLHLPIIPHSLRQEGYTTHLIGKWHLGMSKQDCLPLKRGFDTFFGLYGGSAGYYTHSKQKLAKYANFSVSGYDFRDNDRVALEYKGQYATNLYATRAEQIIAQHGESKKPMFLFVSMQAPHSPLEVPEEYLKQYKGHIKDKQRRNFAGMMTNMDEAIGNITRALNRHGMRQNSVIIFSSDNGGAEKFGADNRPLRGHKSMFYEGGIRVVGFVNSPLLSSRVKGSSYNGLMGAADWYRTTVEGLAGGNIGDVQTDGHNMWDGIRTGTPSPRNEYLHSVGGDCSWSPKLPFRLHDPDNVPTMYGTIRVGKWKLQMGPSGQTDVLRKEDYLKMADSITLFNIHDDPYETSNILESHQDEFIKLVHRLKFHCRTYVQYLPLEEDERSDPRTRDGVYGPFL